MTTVSVLTVCRESHAPIIEGDLPFTPLDIHSLTRPTEDKEVVTLLESRFEAALRTEEGGNLLLTATTRRYDYVLRIMDACVHASVRDRGSRRVRYSTCLNSRYGVRAMLESIVCDASSVSA